MEITILSLGAFLFVTVHLVPLAPDLRDRLVKQLSINGYKGVFALVSLIGFSLMIYGIAKAPHTDVWIPTAWAREATTLLMFPAMLLLAAAKFPTNLKRYTPHPMMWGFVLWSGAHLLANGDLASILFFGSVGIYSVVAMLSANRRGASVSRVAVPIGKEVLVLGFGALTYFAFLFLHPVLFGVAVH